MTRIEQLGADYLMALAILREGQEQVALMRTRIEELAESLGYAMPASTPTSDGYIVTVGSEALLVRLGRTDKNSGRWVVEILPVVR